jgi:hypothetical protein
LFLFSGKEVQKKWKHLRQNYRRELQARKLKSGSEKRKRSPYVYFEMLSFLAPVFAYNQTATSVIEEDEVSSNLAGISSAEIPESAPQTSENRGSKRKRGTDDSVGEVCSMLEESLAVRRQMEEKRQANEEEDEDKQFLLSLVSYMRKVKDVNKLAMRAELLQIVTKYYCRNVSPLNINPPPASDREKISSNPALIFSTPRFDQILPSSKDDSATSLSSTITNLETDQQSRPNPSHPSSTIIPTTMSLLSTQFLYPISSSEDSEELSE